MHILFSDTWWESFTHRHAPSFSPASLLEKFLFPGHIWGLNKKRHRRRFAARKKEIQYRVHNIFYIAIRKFLFFTDIAWSNEGCPFFSLFLLFYNPIPAWHDRLITKSGPMVCPGETPSFHSYKKRTWQARELRALVHFDTLCNAEYLIRIDTYFFDELLCTMLPRYTCLARHSNLGGNTPLDRQQIQDWARTDDLECLHK